MKLILILYRNIKSENYSSTSTTAISLDALDKICLFFFYNEINDNFLFKIVMLKSHSGAINDIETIILISFLLILLNSVSLNPCLIKVPYQVCSGFRYSHNKRLSFKIIIICFTTVDWLLDVDLDGVYRMRTRKRQKKALITFFCFATLSNENEREYPPNILSIHLIVVDENVKEKTVY